MYCTLSRMYCITKADPARRRDAGRSTRRPSRTSTSSARSRSDSATCASQNSPLKYFLTGSLPSLYSPGGIGCIISSILNGKQLDYYYQREEKRIGGDYRKKPDEFRIYLTRLRCLVPFMTCVPQSSPHTPNVPQSSPHTPNGELTPQKQTRCFLTGCTMLGWCLYAKAPLPVTLIANFLCGLGTGTTASGAFRPPALPGSRSDPNFSF